MVNSSRVAEFSGNLQEGLLRLGLTGFHVEELGSFGDFVEIEIRRNA